MSIYEALEKTGGNIEQACKLAKMELLTFLVFMDMDEEFKNRVNAIIEKLQEQAIKN